MNRASILLGIALAVAAAAPSRQPEKIAALDLQQTVQVGVAEQTGNYTVSNGMAQGLSYSLRIGAAKFRKPEDSAAEFFW